MADVVASEITQDADGLVVGYQWKNVGADDVCVPLRIDNVDDLTLSVHGTMDSSSWDLAVSNHSSAVDTSDEMSAAFKAKDANTGNAIELTTTNTAALVSETGTYFQPQHDGGSTAGSMDVTVVLAGK
jgi:hypothetical protein